MTPESWKKGGDGVLFVIALQEEGRAEETIFSKYIDPKANEDERKWHDYEIDLLPYRGKDVTIKFATQMGPRGDGRWDWAVWGAPRLVTISSPQPDS